MQHSFDSPLTMLRGGPAAPAPATGGYGQEDAPGCSIFVKDLPADITAEKLAEVTTVT